MLIKSELNIYKKLLQEAEEEYLDFPSQDEGFSKDYDEYQKKTVPTYNLYKKFNTKYPEYLDRGGIVTYLVKLSNEFMSLLEDESSEAQSYEEDELVRDMTRNFSPREKDLESDNITSFLEKEYATIHIYKSDDDDEDRGINDLISDYIYDTPISDFDLSLEEVEGTEQDNQIVVGEVESRSYDIDVYINKKDSVTIDNESITLEEYIVEFQDDLELLETVFKDSKIATRNYFEISYFKEQVEDMILGNKEKIHNSILIWEQTFSVVVDKIDVKKSFEDYLDDNNINYGNQIFAEPDNSAWEEEE